MDVDTQIGLSLDVGLKIGHLEVVIDPVDHEIGEPGGLSGRLEQFVEEGEALLAEVVPEDLHTHEGAVVEERLCQEGQAVVLHVVVGQVEMHEGLVLRDGLGQGFGAIVGAFVIGEVKGLKGTLGVLEVLGNSLTAFEGDLIGV